MAMTSAICGGVGAGLLIHTAVVAYLYPLFLAPLLLLVPSRQSRAMFRGYCQFWQDMWMSSSCVVLEYVIGVRLFIHSPTALKGLRGIKSMCRGHDVILIKNHRTRIDWMFTWGLCLALDRLGSLKIVMKDSLKKAPFFGWAMQHFGFVFLSRKNRDHDLASLKWSSHYQSHEPGSRMTMLIFPEGTDLSSSNLEKSKAYALKEGLPVYREVLHPKTAGLAAVVAGASTQTLMLDATIAYVENTPGMRPNESGLFCGKPPREVHIRIEDVTNKPSEEDVKEYCCKAFALKEQRLHSFYAPLRDDPPQPPNLAAFAADCEPLALRRMEGTACHMLVACLAFGALDAGAAWLWTRYPMHSLAYLVLASLTSATLTCCGGIDGLEKWNSSMAPA